MIPGHEGPHAVSLRQGEIAFTLRRSRRKTLAITVRPDTSVIVSAPIHAGFDLIKAKVRKRAVWIKRQRAFFEEYLPPTPPRQYRSGETHRYLGRQYRLKVLEGSPEVVTLRRPHILVETRNKSDTGRVKRLLAAWYFKKAKSAIERSLTECLPAFRSHLTAGPQLRLRTMRKRWGSWTAKGIIYLNPELVRFPRSCIDYVVTHELCHLVYGNHGEQFYRLLRRAMPDWEQRKGRLEKSAAK